MPKLIKNWHKMKFNLVKLRFRYNSKIGGYVNKKFRYSMLGDMSRSHLKMEV